MKAPVPPPTMPRRILRLPVSDILLSSAQPENLAIGGGVGTGRRKIVERLLGNVDDVALDERRALGCALLGRLDRALPLEHRPAVETVCTEFRKDAGEIALAVAERAEPARPVHPGLEAAINALL